MADDPYDSRLTRVHPFFEQLFARDASGRSWLAQLLGAAPNGAGRLGPLLERPGSLVTAVAVRTASGRLGCFEYLTAPPRELLAWFIDHPRELEWPANSQLSPETVRLRRALLCDDPPGSQARAQERARELLAAGAPLTPRWWSFETISKLDCVLITDRLVVTIVANRTEPRSPTTEWYPRRSELVRCLEAAKALADGKQWASLWLSERPLDDGTHEHLARVLPAGAPHLDPTGRQELHAAYLGNVTWSVACEATGLQFDSLPNTTADLGATALR